MQRFTTLLLIAALAAACSSGDDDSAAPEPSATPVAPAAATTEPATPPATSEPSATTMVSTPEATTATSATSAPDADPPSTTEPAATPPTTDDVVTQEDLTRFIAAAEVPLQGTAMEGIVFEAPEIYIALAQASCARFSDGDGFDVIAGDLLDEIGPDRSADDQRLVGAILGAATRTICPEHADKI